MESLLRALLNIPEVAEAADDIRRGETPVAMTGLSPIHRAQAAAALARQGFCCRVGALQKDDAFLAPWVLGE